MASLNRTAQSFVLVYDDVRDPPKEETLAVRARLKPFEIEEIVPGTFRVVGEASSIVQSANALGNWKLAPERTFKIKPPYRSKVR